MKSSPRASGRRHHGIAGAGGVEIGEDQVTIYLPDPRILRLVARSVLFAAAIISLPWLLAMLTSDAIEAPRSGAEVSSSTRSTSIRWVDEPFFLPMLVRDLRREGLLAEEGRRVFLGDPSSRLPLLKRNNVDAVSSEEQQKAIRDRSVDFVIAANGLYDAASLVFVERVLRIGGVAVVSLSSDPSQIFRLPRNYMMVYVRQLGNAIVAIKKASHAAGGDDNADDSIVIGTGRKLLAAPGARKENEALHRGDGLLEPPPQTTASGMLRRRVKYLPDVTGDTPSDYPSRLSVDVVRPAGRAGSVDWFDRHYPEAAVSLDVLDEENAAAAAGGISDWIRKNVRSKEMADAAAATTAKLRIESAWPSTGGSRTRGRAVHQWWGSRNHCALARLVGR